MKNLTIKHKKSFYFKPLPYKTLPEQIAYQRGLAQQSFCHISFSVYENPI